jgi:spoIIIJ-associated protein
MNTLSQYTQDLMSHLGMNEVTVDVKEDGEFVEVLITVPEQESGMLIGHHGETIQALQRMLNSVFAKKLDDKKVHVNINDYREKRTDSLQVMAQRQAERAVESGQPQILSNLPAHERLVIHQTLQDFPGVKTYSEGEGRFRRLIIEPISDEGSSEMRADSVAGAENEDSQDLAA